MPRLTAIRPAIRTIDQRTAREPAKVADPHYASPEHKAWRAKVIFRADGRCQDARCDAPARGARLFADHVIELRDGGDAFDPANGLARCGSCHTRKTVAERAKRTARRF